MKKVFISQPMNGKTDKEIREQREIALSAAGHFLNEPVEEIKSFFDDYDSKAGCVPLKYLAKSLELLADADVAYFAPGWEAARGCKIERACAEAYGINIIDMR